MEVIGQLSRAGGADIRTVWTTVPIIAANVAAKLRDTYSRVEVSVVSDHGVPVIAYRLSKGKQSWLIRIDCSIIESSDLDTITHIINQEADQS